ncbi:hypothetical protein [Spiroplasma turonicum]|uniref:Uncharacterized protein n=1 Tax=Spiroplasma turonicum TaxID=216946 RepID=A0A0K1P792_9MOLU|nr:hypothetical protein [Spiroplasma turonicum]AKU80064.1 hypothetical protein STURON_00818 [Spiroplasma turonicum]ALX71066.1 hypothetical protein STURO_v1c08150 [Spiroplasma turonicum]
MKEFYKQSIFWYGLHKVADENAELKYYITTQKELLRYLYPITFVGIVQYFLFKNIISNELESSHHNIVTNYIIENYDELYKIKYRYVNDKPKKLFFKNEEEVDQAKLLISNLLIPYINEYCFKTYEQWKSTYKSYIRESLSIFEYDINHKSDDNSLKTSLPYPFILTLNLIKSYDTKGLYQRVYKCYQKELLLRKYRTGREWKPKELEYLTETYELIQNEEEWAIFLSNFSSSKWDLFTTRERYKALLQLTKLTTILMKDEITAVTMLDDGEELYSLLEDYLPLFLSSDKFIDKNNKLKLELRKSTKKILSPFNFQHINPDLLEPYIKSKGDRFIDYNEEMLKDCIEITKYTFSKLRSLLLSHEYLPQVIDNKIAIKKKLFVNVLNLFEEVKENKFKQKVNVENITENDFMLTEEEIVDITKREFKSLNDFTDNTTLLRIGRVINIMLGIEPKTPKIVNYDLYELFKIVIIIFGPHPLDHTVQNKETIDNLYEKFVSLLEYYENELEGHIKEYFVQFLELPSKLKNWVVKYE